MLLLDKADLEAGSKNDAAHDGRHTAMGAMNSLCLYRDPSFSRSYLALLTSWVGSREMPPAVKVEGQAKQEGLALLRA